jgi:alginate O-acetyltransferase complex protein AlgI
MDFLSIKFIILVIFTVVFYYLVPLGPYRRIVIAICNLIFLLSFVNTFFALFPLAFFLLLGFAFLEIIYRKQKRIIIILEVSAILFVFVYFKKYLFLTSFPLIKWAYLTVGLSYVLFRILHLLIDVYGGAIQKRITFIEYFNYCCFFPCFIAGPIQRFQEFNSQQVNSGRYSLNSGLTFLSFSRILNGYLKIVLITPALLWIHTEFMTRLQGVGYQVTVWQLCLFYFCASCFYTLYIYLNFSGYMDVVVGIGRFLGFSLPENFNSPFTSSKSFLELWSRWHITLSEWFKFYIFNPLLKTLVYWCPSKGLIPYCGVFAFFVTFLLMGIWHGSTNAFIIYGVLLGVGASINKIYDLLARKFLSKKTYAAISSNRYYCLLGGGLTYVYFSFSLTCFWLDINKQFALFRKIELGSFILTFVLGGCLCGGIIGIVQIAMYLLNIFKTKTYYFSENFHFKQGYLACKLFILVLILVAKMRPVPEFVYKFF